MEAPTEVHRFGGPSLADAECIGAAAEIIREASTHCMVIPVAAAMAGVTDELIAAASEAARGQIGQALELAQRLSRRHVDALGQIYQRMGAPVEPLPRLALRLGSLMEEAGHVLQGVALIGELSSRVRDRVISVGEKLSSRLLAAALELRGMPAVALDADTFLDTDGRFGQAAPMAGVADRLIRKAVLSQVATGILPVITGFCGRAPDGATTTLGRGGSDLTATLVAAALGASSVIIWTDALGVYSADPSAVPDARVVAQLNYREASELSFYGARVLHPRSIIPVADPEIPIHIRPVRDPSASGTIIDARFTPGPHPVKAVSAIRGQCLLSLEGKGMAGVPGIAARMFGALAQRELSVTMISQSSSEASICIALPSEDAAVAETALKAEFLPDLTRGDVEEVVLTRGVGILAAVGLGMAHTPGVSARLFTALGREHINVRAIAQGSSELNISFAIDERRVDDALRAVHSEFDLGLREGG